MTRLLIWCILTTTLSAAPMLHLYNSVVTAQTAVGANAPTQTVGANNVGDGTLSLTLSISPPATWLVAAYCASCHYMQFSFASSNLAAGTYTARVTVSDPNAIDSPQIVIVALQVGPISIDQYLAPGSVAAVPIPGVSGPCLVGPCATMTPTTTDGAGWLKASLSQTGTLFLDSDVDLVPVAGMADGTYTGSVALGPPVDEIVPVTMHLTTLPIAVPSTPQLNLQLAQNGPAITYPFLSYISFGNSGMGTLQVTAVSGSGSGVSAYNYNGLAIVKVDPGSLAPGIYTDGMVTIQCNGANCPVEIPVTLEIDAAGPPIANYQGVVDNAQFLPTGSPGDVMVVKGSQLSLQPPQTASAPLPTTLGGASVLVNGVATPLYYSSFGQIAFQVRADTYLGPATVQVVRDGQFGNTVSVNMAQFAPGIAVVTDAAYNLVDATHPVKSGSTLVFWALGLGTTDPIVQDGAAAPAAPPAMVSTPVSVLFASDFFENATVPSFVGLSPGSVGLYQVVATLPASTPLGNVTVTLQIGSQTSSQVTIAIQ